MARKSSLKKFHPSAERFNGGVLSKNQSEKYTQDFNSCESGNDLRKDSALIDPSTAQLLEQKKQVESTKQQKKQNVVAMQKIAQKLLHQMNGKSKCGNKPVLSVAAIEKVVSKRFKPKVSSVKQLYGESNGSKIRVDSNGPISQDSSPMRLNEIRQQKANKLPEKRMLYQTSDAAHA